MLFHELVASIVTVRHILTPLDQATSFSPETKQAEAAQVLKRMKFDGAPVLGGDRVLGHVTLEELDARSSRPVEDRVHSIGPGSVISGDSPVGAAMRWLVESSFLFVLDGRDVAGLITYADISKQPGRLHFFLLIMDFELALSGEIRRHYRDQRKLSELLSPRRAATIERRFREEQAENVESDRVAFMDLSHLLEIGRKDPHIRRAFKMESATTWKRMTGGLIKLRNDIMHPTRQSLLSGARSLPKLIDYEERLTGLTSQAPPSAITIGLFGKGFGIGDRSKESSTAYSSMSQ